MLPMIMQKIQLLIDSLSRDRDIGGANGVIRAFWAILLATLQSRLGSRWFGCREASRSAPGG